MNYVIGYLNYDKKLEKNFFKNILNRIFFKVNISILENDRIEFIINSNFFSKRRILKMKKIFNNYKIDKMLICKDLDDNIFDKEKIINKKCLMKNTIINILKYIYKIQNKDIRLQEIYLTINNDKNKEILFDLAKEVKCINIVTDKIKKLKRLDNKLEKNEDFIYSISNNNKKALKKAKIIINFDYDERFFENFNTNRNAIIINLNDNTLKMKNGYQGIVIENIELNYNNKNNKLLNIGNFTKTELFNAYVYNLNYFDAQKAYNDEKCVIANLVGKNGNILPSELKKSYFMLDKLNKKD